MFRSSIFCHDLDLILFALQSKDIKKAKSSLFKYRYAINVYALLLLQTNWSTPVPN